MSSFSPLPFACEFRTLSCSSPEQTKDKIEFTLNLFEDNGHDRKQLQEIANTYTPPKLDQNTSKTKNKNEKKKSTQIAADIHTKNLFDELPFKNIQLGDDSENKMYACKKYVTENSRSNYEAV